MLSELKKAKVRVAALEEILETIYSMTSDSDYMPWAVRSMADCAGDEEGAKMLDEARATLEKAKKALEALL